MEILDHNTNKRWIKKLLVTTPTLGIVRYEWAHARYNTTMPVNWEATGFDIKYDSGHGFFGYAPVGFSVADAYNQIVKKALELGVEWVLTIEDDVIVPPDIFLKTAQYMDEGKIPIVSGLYYLKAEPTIPLIFRGRGNGAYKDFKIGDKVWVDGLPMGCLLIHASILKWFWENSPGYKLPNGEETRAVFETPRKVFLDPQTGGQYIKAGTQDLYFFDRMIDEKVLQKTGWGKIARRKYPFLCDTSIFCRHIDRNTGRQFP